MGAVSNYFCLTSGCMTHKWKGVNVYLKLRLICLSLFSAHSLALPLYSPISLDFPCPKIVYNILPPPDFPSISLSLVFALFSPLLLMLEQSIWFGEVLGLQKPALCAAVRVGIAWPCPKRLSVTRTGAKVVIPIWQM